MKTVFSRVCSFIAGFIMIPAMLGGSVMGVLVSLVFMFFGFYYCPKAQEVRSKRS